MAQAMAGLGGGFGPARTAHAGLARVSPYEQHAAQIGLGGQQDGHAALLAQLQQHQLEQQLRQQAQAAQAAQQAPAQDASGLLAQLGDGSHNALLALLTGGGGDLGALLGGLGGGAGGLAAFGGGLAGLGGGLGGSLGAYGAQGHGFEGLLRGAFDQQQQQQPLNGQLPGEPCNFFTKAGWCKWGDTCRFSHAAGSAKQVCQFYVKAAWCRWGDTCRHVHPAEVAPVADANGPPKQSCMFFQKAGWCKFGDSCRHAHLFSGAVSQDGNLAGGVGGAAFLGLALPQAGLFGGLGLGAGPGLGMATPASGTSGGLALRLPASGGMQGGAGETCRFFTAQGWCKFGEACRYGHEAGTATTPGGARFVQPPGGSGLTISALQASILGSKGSFPSWQGAAPGGQLRLSIAGQGGQPASDAAEWTPSQTQDWLQLEMAKAAAGVGTASGGGVGQGAQAFGF